MPKIKPVFLALFFCFSAFAQQEKRVPLKAILEVISTQHQVTFNYIEDEIVIYKLLPPNRDLTLTAKIDYIKSQTRLDFTAIGSDSFTVFNDKKMDKPLCGYLRDKETGKPIEAASVVISGRGVSSVSDANGYFELPVVSSNTIRVSHQNYEAFNIDPADLYRPGCPEIALAPVINTLGEIVAQRYLTTGIIKNPDGSFRIMPQQFGILPGLSEADVLQTMQELPGINNEDETISNISVRGGTHDQNLFVWNGIRMFQTGHFFGLISAFNPGLPQTVLITVNGTPAFFGESVSSVADISSHSPHIEEGKTVASVDMLSATVYTKMKLSDNSAVAVSARRSITDRISSPTYRNYLDRVFQNTIVTNEEDETFNVDNGQSFYFYDFTLQYQQKIGRHELFVDGIGIQNRLFLDQVSGTAENSNDLEHRSFGASAQWTANWNSKHKSRINAYVSQYSLNATIEDVVTNTLTLNQKNKVLDLGFKIADEWQFSETLTLNGGYQFTETGVTNFDQITSPAFSRNVTDVLRTHVLAGEAAVKLSKKMFFKAGLRMNYFEAFGAFRAEPRLQFSTQVARGLRLEILGEQKSQTLSQAVDRQQDFLGFEKRRWTLADNGAIPIQKSRQVSLGLNFKRNSWLITFDNFYKKVEGITTTTQGFQNQFEFENVAGNYRVLGSEVLVQKNFGKFYSWLSYCINDSDYRFDSLSTPRFPNNFELTHAFAAAAIYEWESAKIALGGKWHTGRPVTTPTGAIDTTNPSSPQLVYNAPNNSQLPDFFMVNFSASKEWHFSKKTVFQATVSVTNLLNKQNIIGRFYRINADGESIDRIDTQGLAITPNVTLKISF